MDTDSFIIYIKNEDIYEDLADDVEKRFDPSNYEVDIPLPKVTGLMKDELGGKITTEFAAFRQMCILNKSTRLRWATMMIRDCKL